MAGRKRKRAATTTRKAAKKPNQKSRDNAPEGSKDPTNAIKYRKSTDVSVLVAPVQRSVHAKLKNAYFIRETRFKKMAYAFDLFSPARRFKRGMAFNEKLDFPVHKGLAEEDSEATDTDVQPPGLMPYNPVLIKQRIVFECDVTRDTFMSWTSDETRKVALHTFTYEKKAYGRITRTKHTKYFFVPAPYDRIIAQLVKEEEHGMQDLGYEAQRRMSFAQIILTALKAELTTYFAHADADPAAFRSYVLTPLLQRQLWGVEENYEPMVRAAVSNGSGDPTIEQATDFYLGEDPCNPSWIQTYRRNLVYIPEARWHLGIVLGTCAIGNAKAYRLVREHTDEIEPSPRTEAGFPPFNAAEVSVIVLERLQSFFDPELARQPDVLRMALESRDRHEAEDLEPSPFASP